MKVKHLHPRQILDSRGNPTVEVDLWLEDGSFGRAAVPSGASTGSREALELRDGETHYLGKGVERVLKNISQEILPQIKQKSLSQQELDNLLCTIDGTENKSRLGANATLAVSLAFAQAAAVADQKPLYEYIGSLSGNHNFILPRPMFNIMNGGAHAEWTTDIQEYMIQPVTPESYATQLRKAVEVFHHLGKILQKRGYSIHVGNEGGYAPALQSNAEAFEYILEAITAAGYTAGTNGDFMLAIDAAANEFYQDGLYHLKRDNSTKDAAAMVDWIENLTKQYPLISLEDPLAEEDWDAWAELTRRLGQTHQIVGDDLLVTNTHYVEKAITGKNCNAVLVKLNQIGTLSETLDTMNMAKEAGWKSVPSHRSGETEDTFLSHLAVGTGAGQIKTGAPSRTDRTAKYNELLRIEEQLEQNNGGKL